MLSLGAFLPKGPKANMKLCEPSWNSKHSCEPSTQRSQVPPLTAGQRQDRLSICLHTVSVTQHCHYLRCAAGNGHTAWLGPPTYLCAGRCHCSSAYGVSRVWSCRHLPRGIQNGTQSQTCSQHTHSLQRCQAAQGLERLQTSQLAAYKTITHQYLHLKRFKQRLFPLQMPVSQQKAPQVSRSHGHCRTALPWPRPLPATCSPTAAPKSFHPLRPSTAFPPT